MLHQESKRWGSLHAWLEVSEGHVEFASSAVEILKDFAEYLEEEGVPHADVAPVLHGLLDEVLQQAPADLLPAVSKAARRRDSGKQRDRVFSSLMQ